MKNLVVSVSGGRSSGMMARHIQTSPKYQDFNKLYIFANTGKEREETLQFVNDMSYYWDMTIVWIEAVAPMVLGQGIEAMEVNYEKASRNGEPFSAVIEKMNLGVMEAAIPNQDMPYCSGRLKTIPINKYARQYFNKKGYISAIGMRAEDMPKRVTWAEIKQEKREKIYPLLEDFETPISQHQVIEFWKQQEFNLPFSSSIGNCDLCWKKSERKLIAVLKQEPERANWWMQQEQKYGYPFFRGYQFVDDLLKKAQSNTQLDLFSDNGESCFCS